MNRPIAKGLAGIVVDETAISAVEGTCGRLSYRGYPIEELAALPFEQVAYLVLHGDLPNPTQSEAFAGRLAAEGRPSEAERTLIQRAALERHPMCVLQALCALADARDSISLAARVPIWTAYLARWRAGGAWPDYPESERLHARVLGIVHGEAHPRDVDAFDCVQILQLEHSFNAGTFAARVVASTGAPFPNCAAAALGALYGPLHGGADEAALRSAEACGNPAAAPEFVDRLLERGERIMGMGHREYRTVDPRAKVIKPLARRLAAGRPALAERLATLEAIEAEFGRHMAAKGKAVYANVDFFKGIVYLALGFPPEFFTALFASARIFGYAAHFAEQTRNNRLIRPAARYAGPAIRHLPASP